MSYTLSHGKEFVGMIRVRIQRAVSIDHHVRLGKGERPVLRTQSTHIKVALRTNLEYNTCPRTEIQSRSPDRIESETERQMP